MHGCLLKPIQALCKTDIRHHHCPVCHYELLQYSPGAQSPCKSTKKWIAKPWRRGFSVMFWKKFFTCSRPNFDIQFNDSSLLCYKHYMEVYNKVEQQCCKLCATKQSGSWHMFFDKAELVLQQLQKEGSDIDLTPTDWVCKSCYHKSLKPKKETNEIKKSNEEVERNFLDSCIKDYKQ